MPPGQPILIENIASLLKGATCIWKFSFSIMEKILSLDCKIWDIQKGKNMLSLEKRKGFFLLKQPPHHHPPPLGKGFT